MSVQRRDANCVLVGFVCSISGWAQVWTEAQVVDKFLSESPYVREARARAFSAEAEAASRTSLPNPVALASREGAGYAAFFQIEQQLPISGRRSFLKQAGIAAVQMTKAESEATLWSLRTDLRIAFYRVLAAQNRESVLTEAIGELEGAIRILRTREQEGEGSRYDRLRAERELAEYRSLIAIAGADKHQIRVTLTAYLPGGVAIEQAAGALETGKLSSTAEELVQRALSNRNEYIAEKHQVDRSRLETRAAERLRYSEPTVIAGFKRGDVSPGRTQTAPAIGITIPLPLFNKGQTQVAKWRAEEERVSARRDALERRITAEVRGAIEVFLARRNAVEQYKNEVGQTGLDLSKIARTAYEEGEIGILELLDSYRVNRQASLRLVDLQGAAKESQIELDRVVGEEVLP